MKKQGTRLFKRVMASAVTFALLLSMIPTMVFADMAPITITVMDSETQSAIGGATVTVTAPAAGVTVDGYSITLPDSTETISFTVEKDGYTTVNKTDVPVANPIVVEMTPIQVTTTATVASGNGTVKVDGENTVTKNYGEAVSVVITPETGWYVASCTGLDGWADNGFDDTINPTVNTDISVTFAKYLTVTASEVDHGTITLDKTSVKSGDTVQVTVTPAESFWITSVESDPAGLFSDFSNDTHKTGYTKDITITQDTTISAAFAEFFTVTVTGEGNGTITAPTGGTVSMLKNESNKATVTATPSTGYRVASVTVNNGTPTEYTANDQNYTADFAETATVAVTFSANLYDVTLPDPTTLTDGTVTTDKATVEYNTDAVLTITPNNGYDIKSVKVNDVDVTWWTWTSATAATVTIANVMENKSVAVEFEPVGTIADENAGDITNSNNSYVSIDLSGSLFDDKYVFAKDTKLTLTAKSPYTAVRVNGSTGSTSTSFTISESMTIATVDLLGSDGKWHRIALSSALAIVIDKTVPTLDVTVPALESGVTHYNADVPVSFTFTDSNAGLKSLICRVVRVNENDTETETVAATTVYEWTSGEVLFALPETTVFNVSAETNNFDRVKVYVTATDRAGNVTEQTKEIAINATAPTISVQYDNNAVLHEKYFSANRTATITLVDRNSTFDADAATAGITINYAEKDSGTPAQVADGTKNSMLSAWTTDAEDSSKHTATIAFTDDGYYSWSMNYTNKADSSVTKSDTTNDHVFVIDKAAPSGKLAYETNRWSALLSTLTFGLWKNFNVTVSVADIADTSQVVVAYYYSTSGVVTEASLAALEENAWNTDSPTLASENRYVVYARLKDQTDRITYIGSQGIVIDKSVPVITLTPDEANSNGYYKANVTVAVNVEDPGTYAGGLKSVTYQVFADYTDTSTTTPTQSDTLYSFTPTDAASGVEEAEMIQVFETDGTTKPHIVIDTEKNNSDNVRLIVRAEDNAGNITESTKDFAINVTAPQISVAFAADTAVTTVAEDTLEHGYFGAARTAAVTVVDRATTFDAAAATAALNAKISAKDGENNSVNTYTISEWTTDAQDSTQHRATITFGPDARYSFAADAISYTNMADMANENCTVTGTTPYLFTVDATEPSAGSVSIFEVASGDTTLIRAWNEFLTALTFGIYKRTSVKAEASGEDAISPLKYEYFVTNEVLQKTAQELDGKTFTEGAPTLDPQQVLVVYAKISDYAGNYIYRQTDGAILDTAQSSITCTIPTQAHNGIYNSDVKINVKVVDDSTASSGIKSVTYRVVKDGDVEHPTQSGALYTFEKPNPAYADLRFELDSATVESELSAITISSELNNSSNVVVYVKAIDNADNEIEVSQTLDIDITAPTVAVSYDRNNGHNSKYFSGSASNGATRTATVVITERTSHFVASDATEAMENAITATSGGGSAISEGYSISEWTTVEGATPDAAQHTATIRFIKDANYTFKPSYTDKASNASGAVTYAEGTTASEEFTVDNTSPSATLNVRTLIGSGNNTAKTASWNSLVKELTFGFWSPNEIAVRGHASDATSPIASVQYYERTGKDAEDEMNSSSLSRLNSKEWHSISDGSSFDVLTIEPDRKSVVYLSVTDMAGHTTYVSTNGLIADKTLPHEEYTAPELTVEVAGGEDTVFHDDVTVKVKVSDPIIDESYSGLQTVDYRITSYDVDEKEANTKSGSLHSFDIKSPKAEDLLQEKEFEIPVSAADFNSNRVEVSVTAKDNAGNSSTKEIVLKIDVTPPSIHVTFDNNNGDGEGQRFFHADRTMTITVKERNFDGVLFGTQIPGAAEATWAEVPAASGNGDGTLHIAKILFSEDDDYTVAMSCKDKAGNACDEAEVVYEGVAPTAFTIDKTLPTVTVSYDNNDARNGNYYRADRTATITVRERNFNPERVSISGAGVDNGTAVSFPGLRGWTDDGVVHTAHLLYASDAQYHFDIAVKDEAGNDSADYAEETFYIDKTMPELRFDGVLDHSANKDTVAPVVTFTDTNFDQNGVKMPLVGANNGEVNYAGNPREIANGLVYSYEDFNREKKVDDLYTLRASVVDLAGNETEDMIMFSVNRFGSVYVMKEATVRINNTYIKEPVDVVVKEINPDRLEETKVTLFKNDRTIELSLGEDYSLDVVGGGDRWYEYTYTIFAKNFSDDGVYRVLLHSLDAAGNVAENTLDTKDAAISFGVDKTNPTLTVLNLESNTTYPAENITVNMLADDNLVLSGIRVYLDDYSAPYRSWKEDEISAILAAGGDFTFDVSDESTKAHKALIVCSDAAGNETVVEFVDFYVTTNIMVRYFNNKPIFYGSIGTVGAGVVALVLVKTHGAAAAASARVATTPESGSTEKKRQRKER